MIKLIYVNGKLIRRKLFLIVDTETFGSFSQPLCYDIGCAVIDKYGKVYAKYSFVVHDTFIGMAQQAATAYYANKFPQYHEDIRNGKRILLPLYDIITLIDMLMQKWGISDVVAHNAKFDCTSLNYTAQYFGYSSFFKRHVEWWDTLQMVADTIGKQKLYIRFCQENGYLRKKTNKPQLKAEVVYRYISGIVDFIEKHTGIEDVMIEKDIFAKCFAQHKSMKHSFYVYN